MGSAIGLAALAVAIDHTRHSLPEAESNQGMDLYQIEGESPCSMSAPCSMGSSPCSMGSSPCSMGN